MTINPEHLLYDCVMWVNFAIPYNWRLHDWWFTNVVLRRYKGKGGYRPGEWLRIFGICPLGKVLYGVDNRPVLDGPMWAIWTIDKFMRLTGVYIRLS
jgi:hypothetical protein